MFALITGGAGSGKSEYAEQLAVRLAGQQCGPLVYLATMVSGGKEADARIRKHRKSRAGRGFRTVERYTDLSGTVWSPLDTVLIEDLGNLMGNEMFLPEGGGREAALAGVRHVQAHTANLIAVANEVFSDGQKYDPETMTYLRELALVQRMLAEQADFVAEVACGLPNMLKGSGLVTGTIK